MQGQPEHPSTHGALCTKVSRYPERTYHAERVLHPLKRVSAKHEPPRFERIGWDEALADIAGRLQAIAARDPQAILPYSYAGTMGLLQGEAMAGRFFNRLGASCLDRTICASAGGAALAATYGHKVGMHLPHFAESKLILIWGSNSIASNLHFWTFANQAKRERREADLHRPAQDRDRRQVPPAPGAAARHRRRAGAGPDARADRRTTGWTTTTSPAMSRAGRSCARGRWPGRRSARPPNAA